MPRDLRGRVFRQEQGPAAGRPRSDILAYTRPGFATSDHTKSNSLSPRGDWRAPSDSNARAWLRDLVRWEWPDAG